MINRDASHAPKGKRIVIFGGKGSAVSAAKIVAESRGSDQVLGLLNDQVARGSIIHGFEVLGAFADWEQLPSDVVFSAPLHRVKEAPKRLALVDRLRIPDARWTNILHPYCSLSSSAVFGRGAVVEAFANIGAGTMIGRHLKMSSCSSVTHDCSVGDFVSVGVSATVSGYCEIGDGAYIGPNSSIKDGITIGKFAVIGIGACVIRDVADFEIVIGNPARRIGFLPEAELPPSESSPGLPI